VPFEAAMPAGPLFSDWSAAEWYGQRARWLLEQGDMARANRTAVAARASAPATARSLDSLMAVASRRKGGREAYDEGVQLLRAGQKADSRVAFERAVAADPELAAAWVLLSERRRVDGDLAGAAAAIQLARRSSDLAVRGDAEIMAGLLELAKKDPKAALQRFTEAQRFAPLNAQAYLYEASVHAQSGDVPSAVAALRRGLAASPGSHELSAALAQLGQVP